MSIQQRRGGEKEAALEEAKQKLRATEARVGPLTAPDGTKLT